MNNLMITDIDWDNIFIVGNQLISIAPSADSRKPRDILSLINEKDLKLNLERHTEFIEKMEKGEGFGWEIQ